MTSRTPATPATPGKPSGREPQAPLPEIDDQIDDQIDDLRAHYVDLLRRRIRRDLRTLEALGVGDDALAEQLMASESGRVPRAPRASRRESQAPTPSPREIIRSAAPAVPSEVMKQQLEDDRDRPRAGGREPEIAPRQGRGRGGRGGRGGGSGKKGSSRRTPDTPDTSGTSGTSGAAASSPSRGAASRMTLVEAIEHVMKNRPRASIAEVVRRVTDAGYESGSKDFRSRVNKVLRKGPQFRNVDRGVYEFIGA